MIWSESLKIGVIGTYNSGKTVFLTSLLNHLLHHNSEVFKLKGDSKVVIKKAEFLNLDSRYLKFPYQAHRDALVREGRWPEKTLHASYQRVGLNLNRGYQRTYDITLFDFPGEGLADASIAALDWSAWSKLSLAELQDHQNERDLAYEYLNLLEKQCENIDELCYAFKLYLARKRKNFRPLIQPSSFILSDQSKLISSQLSVEEMVQGRYLGTELKEFLPLPEAYMQSKSQLCKQVERHYREYQQNKVLPLFKELASCDSLLILADLPTMLNSGSDMCNDTIELVKACLDFCQPGKNAFESLYSISQLPQLYRQSTDFIKQLPLLGPLSQMLLGQKSPLKPITTTVDQWLGLKKIKRLVVAASKCDLVHESDRDHLKVLLRELFQSTASAHSGLDLHWVNLSAAVATRSSSEHHALMGQPELNESGAEQLIRVSQLPEHWPHQWRAGDFCFPDFKPKRFPGLKVQTPDHYNLDRVFNHLMGWST